MAKLMRRRTPSGQHRIFQQSLPLVPGATVHRELAGLQVSLSSISRLLCPVPCSAFAPPHLGWHCRGPTPSGRRLWEGSREGLRVQISRQVLSRERSGNAGLLGQSVEFCVRGHRACPQLAAKGRRAFAFYYRQSCGKAKPFCDQTQPSPTLT